MNGQPNSWEAEKAELDAILASDLFARAPSLAQLLKYICEKHFTGEDHLIKEYNIAVEALGRHADFDQKKDSIVRVEAHRLRKRLRSYYMGDGAGHQTQIEIPSGGYIPIFRTVEPGMAPQTEIEPAFDDFTPLPFPAPAAAVPRRPRWPYWIGGLGAVGLAAAFLVYRYAAAPQPASTTPAGVVQAEDSLSEVRIRCGGGEQFVDREGHVWIADKYFSGGDAKYFSSAEIEGTFVPELFRYRRQGGFGYRVPLKPGVYELTLAFVELGVSDSPPAESERLFDVLVNGTPLLTEFDILTDSGRLNRPTIRVFKDIQPNQEGYLELRFQPRVRDALVSFISVLPGTPGRIRPVRIAARERPYTDSAGRLWVEDRFFTSGKLVRRIEAIEGTDDQELYRGERYGRFSYIVPVPPDSTYTVVAHFAETWWGGTGGGGAGSRIFDLLCNGRMLAQNLDVFVEAGGSFRAIRQAYRGLRPRANGKLVLDFIPTQNYAFINAIEILDESPGDNRPTARPGQPTR